MNKIFENLFGDLNESTKTVSELQTKLENVGALDFANYLAEEYRLTVSVTSNYDFRGSGKILFFYIIKDTMDDGIINEDNLKIGYSSYKEAFMEGLKVAIKDTPGRM